VEKYNPLTDATGYDSRQRTVHRPIMDAAASADDEVNSIGNIGGFVGPSLVGFVREATDSFAGGLFVIAASLLAAAVVALTIPQRRAA
jgi:nitrate/nitrite transporter NarK